MPTMYSFKYYSSYVFQQHFIVAVNSDQKTQGKFSILWCHLLQCIQKNSSAWHFSMEARTTSALKLKVSHNSFINCGYFRPLNLCNFFLGVFNLLEARVLSFFYFLLTCQLKFCHFYCRICLYIFLLSLFSMKHPALFNFRNGFLFIFY